MKHTYIKYTRLFGTACLASGLALTSCTGNFEKWNTNPNEVTSGQMEQDNLNIGAYFTQMEKGVLIVGKDLGGKYQETEMLTGDIFASYIANINDFSYTNTHNDHYALYHQWYNSPWEVAYVNIMQPWKSISEKVDASSPAFAMATVIKVFAMQRITDMYGPIPYSKFGTSIQVEYDSQKDVYYQFFEELDAAINVLADYASSSGKSYMEDYDYIYKGNVSKWVKFANTLRLRLAMRISYVDKAKAVEEASAAINHGGGLMSGTDDSAILHQGTSLTFVNPIWEVSESFEDVRMSATMDCYLKGYNDPRLDSYFRRAADGEFHGVQNGQNSGVKDKYKDAASGINYAQNSDLPWMNASEAYFLLAEAKLRLGLGAESAQTYYENGIKTSFAIAGVQGADNYIADDESLPLESYIDPSNNRSLDVSKRLSYVTIAWNESDGEEKNMERIMVQKWIALFPIGQEAWSEMRRTGYPGFVYLANKKGSEVADGELISRLKFPTTEYTDNSANTQAAAALLGGNDKAGTRLWWDTRR